MRLISKANALNSLPLSAPLFEAMIAQVSIASICLDSLFVMFLAYVKVVYYNLANVINNLIIHTI